MSCMQLETDHECEAVDVAYKNSQVGQEISQWEQECHKEQVFGCYPVTSQSGIYLGDFPSLWQ